MRPATDEEKPIVRWAISVHNEQAKLLAAAFDRASTACLTVGVFGPIAVVIFGTAAMAVSFFSGVVCVFCWFSAAWLLHMMAQRTLRMIV